MGSRSRGFLAFGSQIVNRKSKIENASSSLQHRRTARLLHRLRFHQFHPREIWIIKIELPLAIPSNLRLFLRLVPALKRGLIARLDTGHTQRSEERRVG